MVVLGGGAIGLLAAMVYRAMGVRKLWVAEPNAHRREMVAKVVDAEVYDPGAAGPAPGSTGR